MTPQLLLVLLLLPQSRPQSAPQSGPASRGDELRQQMGSREPFTIAWAAAQARDQSARWLCDALPEALATLATLPATDERLIATATVLDAMIELGCPVDSAVLRTTNHFGQALRLHVLILASRSPARCAGFLLELRPQLRGDLSWQTATNLLVAADPTAAARVLTRETSLRLRIAVHDPGRDPERGERPLRRAHTQVPHGVPVPRSWPGTGRYRFVQAFGPDGVGFRREVVLAEAAAAVEFDPEDGNFYPVDRDQHRLLSLWRLAGNEDKPPFLATTRIEEEWSDLATHCKLVEQQSDELSTAWRQLIDRLVQRGHLRPDPRDDTRPPVFVELVDQRRRKDPPLPRTDR